METEIDSLIFACMNVHVKLQGLFDAGTALLFIHFFYTKRKYTCPLVLESV